MAGPTAVSHVSFAVSARDELAWAQIDFVRLRSWFRSARRQFEPQAHGRGDEAVAGEAGDAERVGERADASVGAVEVGVDAGKQGNESGAAGTDRGTVSQDDLQPLRWDADHDGDVHVGDVRDGTATALQLYPARSWRTAASIAPHASLRETSLGSRSPLGEELREPGAAAVFSCSDNHVYEEVQLPRHTRGRVEDADPYGRPMLSVLDEYCRTCAVMMGKECGQVSEYHLDQARSQRRP